MKRFCGKALTARRITWLVLLGLGCSVSACDGKNPVACTALFAYGLSVQAEDSVSGTALSVGLVVTAREGDYVETLQSVDGFHFVGAGERAGTYTVGVSKAGYQPWERAGVVVTKDECHVRGASVIARMQPLP